MGHYDRANATWACWADWRVTAGRSLTYLADHRIGLVAYDLVQPRMLESASLTHPNHIRANWQCVSGLNEGAGSQIMHWFALPQLKGRQMNRGRPYLTGPASRSTATHRTRSMT